MSGHTPGPWRIRTNGNIGNAIEADCGLRSPLFADNGFRTVATFQSCCASDRYDEQQANALANAHLIVAAPDLKFWLSQLLDALPAKRDWLDPVIEANAHAALARAGGGK